MSQTLNKVITTCKLNAAYYTRLNNEKEKKSMEFNLLIFNLK